MDKKKGKSILYTAGIVFFILLAVTMGYYAWHKSSIGHTRTSAISVACVLLSLAEAALLARNKKRWLKKQQADSSE